MTPISNSPFFSNMITTIYAVIEENGVRLRLNIVDTPGYGDQVNNENW
jgi:septin family protein